MLLGVSKAYSSYYLLMAVKDDWLTKIEGLDGYFSFFSKLEGRMVQSEWQKMSFKLKFTTLIPKIYLLI